MPFSFPAHINILEAQALLSCIRLCVQEGKVSQRIIVVVDSWVVNGAVRKLMLRQLAALSLANDLYIEVLWVPTWANPSDAPSSGAPVAACS